MHVPTQASIPCIKNRQHRCCCRARMACRMLTASPPHAQDGSDEDDACAGAAVFISYGGMVIIAGSFQQHSNTPTNARSDANIASYRLTTHRTAATKTMPAWASPSSTPTAAWSSSKAFNSLASPALITLPYPTSFCCVMPTSLQRNSPTGRQRRRRCLRRCRRCQCLRRHGNHCRLV